MVYVENELMGKRLRRVRMDLGMNYWDMADILGVSEGHYRKIERGIYGLDAKKLLCLYSRLKIDPLYILTGDRGRPIPYNLSKKISRESIVCELLDYCKKQLVDEEEQ